MNTLIFDYDDTLALNQHYYSYAQIDFVKLVLERLGPKAPNAPAILNRQTEIDKNLVKTRGFVMERFAESLVQTYGEISKKMNINDKEGESIAYQIGMSIFDEKKYLRDGLVPGAVETLDFIKEQGDELMLFTAGDLRVQNKKIQATQVAKWFENNIYIVSRKDEVAFQLILGSRNREKAWMIGNSMRSDILPALNVGIKAIYLPQDTWAFEAEHAAVPINNPKLITLDSILDIKREYDTLFL